MNIILITPIYATTTQGAGATPVVHYFTREWVKKGNSVRVFHFIHRFPSFYYIISKLFQHQLNTRFGMLVPIVRPHNNDYVVEDVIVHCRCLRKTRPHTRFSRKQIAKAYTLIEQDCIQNGIPDVFIGHWDNPQLEILCLLKERFHKPICLVLHSNRFDFDRLYGSSAKDLLSKVDTIGFRNRAAENEFVTKYGHPKSSFIAYSGVSKAFLDAGKDYSREYVSPVRNYVFVGSLIARKYPEAIVAALNRVYPEGNFKLTYIGDGAEKEKIIRTIDEQGIKADIIFTGRIQREAIINYLKDADVFVMISRGEIFGLVYLEAMALGVIPVGSKNEGIDGIIKNGDNGFLCEAGNVDELTSILEQIKGMSICEIEKMSLRAKETASAFSDCGVAENYLNAIKCY